MRPGLEDVLVVGGLLLIGGGLWFIHPPAAAVVVGTLLFVIGVALGRPGRAKPAPAAPKEDEAE